MNETKTVKLRIQNHYDRSQMICALANAGYKVWAEEKNYPNTVSTDYWVYFEVNESYVG